MLLSAVQIKAQHRVAVGAALDALANGLIAGLQDLHVGLGRVRVGDGPGGKGLVIILNNLRLHLSVKMSLICSLNWKNRARNSTL